MDITGNVKPKLRLAAPLTYYICWGYAIVNIIFGIGLLSYKPTIGYIIVNRVISYDVYAWVFMILGILGGITLLVNRWRLIRLVAVMSLFIKALWFFALLFRITSGGALVTFAMWTALAYVQLLTVIYFPEG